MRYLFTILFALFVGIIFAQERIDSTLNFQTNPAKKFSIYVPSNYDAATPNKLMLGLHPLNTNRWDGISWCDTLIQFAEANDLLLICPDGGVNGQIDDPIDTAFTTLLLDSMTDWYNVDEDKVYAMGFSWGGKTVYTYGLNHAERFAGFMPIGAAVDVSEVSGISANAQDKPFYIVHGSSDSPNVRFTPLRDAMMDADACVETNLLSGVGHTIDFPNRNMILTEAFQWLESVACNTTTTTSLPAREEISLFPNPVSRGQAIQIGLPLTEIQSVQIYNWNGQLISSESDVSSLPIINESGIYIVKTQTLDQHYFSKIVVE